MKKIWFSTLSLLCTCSLLSQTNVGGPLFSNTTWNLSGSPYILTADVQVAPGVTLTIAPGVQVKFPGDHEILVKGSIIANGTSSQTIQFSGLSGKAMILFKSCNLSTSQFKHVSFTGPKYALSLGNDPVENTEILFMEDIILTKSRITTTGDNTSAHIVMERAILDSARVIGGYPNGERIEFNNSVIENSFIESQSYHLGMYVNLCSVNASTLSTACCGSSVTITSSTLNNCSISHEFAYSDRGHSRIQNSRLINCEVKHDYGTLEMDNCLVNYDDSTFITMASGYVNCTHITGNGTGTAIHTTGYSNFPYPPVVLHNTRFANNTTAIHLTGSGKINIDSCSSYLNSSYHINNETALNFTVVNSYWGSSDSASIAAKIRDYYDNINYGKVIVAGTLGNIYLPSSCPDTIGKVTPPPPPPPLPTSLNEQFRNHQITLYPNPTTGLLTIHSEAGSGDIQILNQLGQVVVSRSLHEKETTIDLDHLPGGIYYCRMSGNGFVDVKKVVLR